MKPAHVAVLISLTVWGWFAAKASGAGFETPDRLSLRPAVIEQSDVSPSSPSGFWMGFSTLVAAGLWRGLRHIRIHG
jgi:hypothetical protein